MQPLDTLFWTLAAGVKGIDFDFLVLRWALPPMQECSTSNNQSPVLSLLRLATSLVFLVPLRTVHRLTNARLKGPPSTQSISYCVPFHSHCLGSLARIHYIFFCRFSFRCIIVFLFSNFLLPDECVL